MRIRVLRQTTLALVAFLVMGFCFVSADAQTTRNKRSRRATNPVRRTSAPVTTPAPQTAPTPTTTDAQIISTADDPLTDTAEDEPPVNTRRTNRSTRSTASESEPERMQRTVNRLSRQVDKLTDKLEQIEGQQRALVDLERLSRAEQRAESFRAQLRDVQDKEATMQARLEQIEYDLKPENIERNVAIYGTTRPEDAREARRRQLESERTRIQTQLNLLQTSRIRLESAIALADTEVERLRARLEESDPLIKTQTNESGNNTTEPPNVSETPATAPPNTTAPYSSPSGTP